ncbi:hypothetical protein ACIQGT_14105 [Streptomyces sp. NPDC093108]|uniref:hypothetical protein n=1 Tax=unclassified Streptomyces TaxID=2593676 RepID=UPI003814179B
MTVFLIVGARGNWKIKLDDGQVVVVAFITGQLYAQAGETFAFVARMSGGLSEAIRSSFKGEFGAGAVALVMCLVIYGLKPSKLRNSLFGLMLPAMFTAAGEPFTFITTMISNATHMVA